MTDLRDQLQTTLGSAYALERELGGGGMSRVFVAEETSLGRKVVVKVLPPDLAATVNVERFRREIQLAARLQHPHIVPLLSAGISDGLPYYTMPLVEGDSLRTRMSRQGELPIQDTVRILRDIASALEYAHEQGVVHRDIKPDNVLLTRHHALVTDFGVAKALSASTNPGSSLTSLGVALGTPAYMSPEQATADPATDHRTDIYALGALAYEMLTGRQLFSDRSPQAMLRAHAVEQPDPIETRRPTVLPPLAALVMRMVEKHPADRPQTAEDVLRTLDTFVATPSGGMTPTATVPISAATLVQPRRIPRSRALIAAALVGAGLLAAAGMLARRQGGGPALDDRRVVVAPFENKTGDARYDALGASAADWIARGLTQAGIVDVAPILAGAALEGTRSTRESAGGDTLVALARAAGAGRIVSGGVYLRGDSIQFQGVITDVEDGKVLGSLTPSTSPLSDPMAGMNALRQRVMIALAAMSDVETSGLAAADAPPNYEAYQEFMLGEEAFARTDFRTAIAHYDRAVRMDGSYSVPLVRSAYAYSNLNECRGTDSIGVMLKERRARLSAFESHYLDRVLARCQGDWNAHYRAGRQMLAVAPKSSFAIYVAGRSALFINRPREALEVLGSLNPSGSHTVLYFLDWTAALHALGEHKRELKFADLARAQHPESPAPLGMQARALAALGRIGPLEGVVAQVMSSRAAPQGIPGSAIATAVQELEAHGRADDARRLRDRYIGWLQRLPVRQRTGPLFAVAFGSALSEAGRHREARRLADSLVGTDSNDVAFLRLQGTTAARQREVATAERVIERLGSLETPYLRGVNSFAQATIAAELGRADDAIAYLMQALASGQSFFGGLHATREFASLRNHREFKRLLEPKG